MPSRILTSPLLNYPHPKENGIVTGSKFQETTYLNGKHATFSHAFTPSAPTRRIRRKFKKIKQDYGQQNRRHKEEMAQYFGRWELFTRPELDGFWKKKIAPFTWTCEICASKSKGAI
jgi:hypothetical protein